MAHDVVDTLISPEGHLEILSKTEVAKLLDTSQGGLYQVFRNCALAVLNTGSTIDDGKELLERALIEKRLDALKSLGAVDLWAAQNGFTAPDRMLRTSLVASRE